MKKVLFILFIASALVSCKSNSSIVTSKNDAKKKGLYSKAPSTRGTEEIKSIAVKSSSIKSVNNTKPSDILITEYNTSNFNNYTPNDEIFSADLINEAKNYLGVRYRSGGTTRAGMDCSGLVTTVFKQFDFSLPRTSRDMAKVGVEVKRKSIAPGDLVFFKTNGRSVINHVGIVVDVDGDQFKFIHSSTSKGVIISSNSEPYYKRAYAQANRVF